MIEIQTLTKKYGTKSIVENWNYEFKNGKIYGLIGRNGIGKTTILKCMCGLCKPDKILIRTDQGDVTKKDFLYRDMYYISDEPIYYNDLTLYEHLWMICKVEKESKEEAKRKINLLVEQFKMKEYLDYFPTAMSKGTLQRMLIMIGFLKKKTNLLMDEPFNGLDPIQLKQVLEYCKQHKEEKCFIISSHDVETLEELCDIFLICTKDGIITIEEKIDRETVNAMIGDSYV